MNSGSNTSAMGDMSMVPFFHWAGGDYLLFQAWSPTSPGAIAGASFGLVCLALFDRWLAATRGALDNHWRHKGLAMASRPLNYSGKSLPSPTNETSDKSSLNADSADDSNPLAPLTNRRGTVTLTRTVPPFIWAHDLPRGLLHAGQSLLSYALMLAVMTFNAAYVISIVVGLGMGEAIFGRMGNGRGAGH